MKFGQPEIVKENGKTVAKLNVGLDTDGDGVNSISAGIFVELNEGESVDEAVKRLLGTANVPAWLKIVLSGLLEKLGK